jgi:acetate kinase
MTDSGMILAINAGSSSVKFAAFRPDFERAVSGTLEGIGSRPRLRASVAGIESLEDWSGGAAGDVPDLIRRLMAWIEARIPSGGLRAIGHRVAIGGLDHSGPARITPDVLCHLSTLVPLAPLHQPRNLEPIEILTASHPGIPQVACFDTAFHRTLPREIRARICEHCSWLGLKLSDSDNHGGSSRISAQASGVTTRVIPTDEERMVAEHTARLSVAGSTAEMGAAI